MADDEPAPVRLQAFAVQLIEVAGGVILKRGGTEFVVSGPRAKEIVEVILSATSGTGATSEQICDLFAPPDRSTVEAFLAELTMRRVLVPAALAQPPINLAQPPINGVESALEVFYWQFGFRFQDITEQLSTKRVAVIGVNGISRRVAASLVASGMPADRVEVVDFLLLRNLRLFDGTGKPRPEEWPAEVAEPVPYQQWADGLLAQRLSTVVATSDFGGMHLLRQWNEFCVEERLPLLPVVLQDCVGYVGPLVVPGETACYECLRARQNAVMDDPETQRLPERAAFHGQFITAYHPAMASILGDIAAVELLKFFTGIPMSWAGTLFEVSLLQPSMVGRKVLKLPRCPVCSTLNRRSSTTPYIDEYMHERQ
jgi:molybdopterin-synthase adenylyltransferase